MFIKTNKTLRRKLGRGHKNQQTESASYYKTDCETFVNNTKTQSERGTIAANVNDYARAQDKDRVWQSN